MPTRASTWSARLTSSEPPSRVHSGRLDDHPVHDGAGCGWSWLLASGRGVGYLLKSRVTDVEEFLDTLGRIAKGGSVVDPTLVADGAAPVQVGGTRCG